MRYREKVANKANSDDILPTDAWIDVAEVYAILDQIESDFNSIAKTIAYHIEGMAEDLF